jgi:dihydropteroate synthase
MISTGQNTAFSTNKTLNLGGRLMVLNMPIVMGIVNVTPDSFYDGGHLTSETSLLKHAEKMIADGAAILDIGGYSSRPGAADISPEKEFDRVISAIKSIKSNFPEAVLSVDTFRASIAHAAVQEGALLVNDISGGELDPEMIETVARLKVPYICMHMKGRPQNMSSLATYDDLLQEVIEYFHQKLAALRENGIIDVILDPGFGFAKTVDHNFELLGKLQHLQHFGKPILTGLSRKSMVWRTLNTTPDEALNGTTVLHTLALVKGASILRVHDVKEANECIKLYTHIYP